MNNYIEFEAARIWLQSQGVHRLDIERVLDLTSVKAGDGNDYCHKTHLTLLARHAYRMSRHSS